MSDLLNQLVQLFQAQTRNSSTASSTSGSSGTTGTGTAAASQQLTLPQLLTIVGIARDNLVLQLGREQFSLPASRLNALSANSLQVGQQLLLQQLPPALISSGSTSGAGGGSNPVAAPQQLAVAWQQVQQQLTQLLLQLQAAPTTALPKLAERVQAQVATNMLMLSGGSGQSAWQLPLPLQGQSSPSFTALPAATQTQLRQFVQSIQAALGQSVAQTTAQTGAVTTQLQLTTRLLPANLAQASQAQVAMTLTPALSPAATSPSPTTGAPGQPATPQSVTVNLPLAQLPPAIVQRLLSLPASTVSLQGTSPPAPASPTSVAPANLSTAQPTQPLPQAPLRQALAPLQSTLVSPGQLAQQLSALLATATLRPVATEGTPSTQTAPIPPAGGPAASPVTMPLERAALSQLLQSMASQLPQGMDFTRAEALQHWVSQWFAARPVSLAPQQSLAGVGQVLLLLLGAKLGQQPNPPASTNAWLRQTANWLQPTPAGMTPAPAQAAPTAAPTNALAAGLQQLTPATVQQALQLLSGTMSNARMSQANLADTARVNTPDYHILLPMGGQAFARDAEVLVQRRTQPKKGGQENEDIWLFKLKMELQRYGPVLVKGKYKESGTVIQFITENLGARVHIQEHLKDLQARLGQLNVDHVELSAIRGKVPDALSELGENIIRIQV